jgi:hypothetical protein
MPPRCSHESESQTQARSFGSRFLCSPAAGKISPLFSSKGRPDRRASSSLVSQVPTSSSSSAHSHTHHASDDSGERRISLAGGMKVARGGVIGVGGNAGGGLMRTRLRLPVVLFSCSLFFLAGFFGSILFTQVSLRSSEPCSSCFRFVVSARLLIWPWWHRIRRRRRRWACRRGGSGCWRRRGLRWRTEIPARARHPRSRTR